MMRAVPWKAYNLHFQDPSVAPHHVLKAGHACQAISSKHCIHARHTMEDKMYEQIGISGSTEGDSAIAAWCIKTSATSLMTVFSNSYLLTLMPVLCL